MSSAARPLPARRFSANMSILYGDRPLLDRPAAARDAGFAFVESWWPFDDPTPSARQIDDLCHALDSAGVRLVAINLDTGDTDGGDRGLLSDPTLGARISDNLHSALEVIDRTGARIVNVLYGNRISGEDPGEQDRVALRRLASIADTLAAHDAVVVLETLNSVDSPRFPFIDIESTSELAQRAGRLTRQQNIGLLLDTYHLATMGTDPVRAIHRYAPLIRHVQFADFPGRGRPGTGRLDFTAIQQALDDVGYPGFIGLEYKPFVGAHSAEPEVR